MACGTALDCAGPLMTGLMLPAGLGENNGGLSPPP